MGLLDKVGSDLAVYYLSDLRDPRRRDEVRAAVERQDANAYPAREWADLSEYLLHRKTDSHDAGQIKRSLCTALRGAAEGS